VPWDGSDAEGLVGRLFELSLAGFARNRFFKPITRRRSSSFISRFCR
jgi:hypothetical protein